MPRQPVPRQPVAEERAAFRSALCGAVPRPYNGVVTKSVSVELCTAVLTVLDNQPQVLTLSDKGRVRLPSDRLRSTRDQTLEFGARRLLRRQVGLEPAWLEQLYTFGDRRRNFWPRSPGRTITVAYLALVRHDLCPPGGQWRRCYEFFPWEDRRAECGAMHYVSERLEAWRNRARADANRLARTRRISQCLGLGKAGWTPDLVLERYELVYEAGLVAESWHDRGAAAPAHSAPGGSCMALDHRRILATALGRMRGKLRYRPLAFELLPAEFTLYELQQVIEAIVGHSLHKPNFRRLVANQRLVEETAIRRAGTGGRPARLYRFRPEALAERRTAGVLS